MATNRTFTMVKPDGVESNNIGNILAKINEAGFRIVAMKYTRLSAEQAGVFYEVHKERPFYGELVDYMSSGPIVAAILEKDNAVADFRTLIGATDPAEAAEGTIRALYAESKAKNAVQIKNRLRSKGITSRAIITPLDPKEYNKTEITQWLKS